MNELCNLLKINYPIIQGGMGNISHAKLTAAVSEAGGLGTIGCGTMPPEAVESIILETKELTNKPFAINIALSVTPYVDELMDLIIKHEIDIVSLSAGNPAPHIPTLQKHHVTILALVASVDHAKKAEKAGAHIVVAEGFEAAGINSPTELTTFTLIPQIAQEVNIPVIAAGGIGDGRGLAAAFMLGASGVQIGTRLIATKEAPFHEKYKQKLLSADDQATMIIGRKLGRTRRVLKTPYAEQLLQLEQDGMNPEEYAVYTSEDRHVKGALEGDFQTGFLNGGQISGIIQDIPTVKNLLLMMMKQASEQIHHTSLTFK